LWTVAIVGAIQLGLKNEKSPVKLWGPLIIALIVLIFALAVTLYTVSDLMCNGGQVIQGCFKNGSLENRSKEIIPIVYFLAVFVIWIGCRQSVFLSSRSTLIFSPNKILIWSIIALTVFMPVKFSFQPDAKEIKRKEAIKQFVSVVPKGETVYSGLESSLLRLKRRQFMDWKYEATMTYYPKAIQNFDKRARSMGLNLVEEAPGDYICEPWRWLVIRRCGKRFFVIEDANDWRGRLPEMRKVVPTLTKALIRTSEVQGEDILSSYGKYSIISLP